jgi:ribosomal protein L30E
LIASRKARCFAVAEARTTNSPLLNRAGMLSDVPCWKHRGLGCDLGGSDA